MIGITLESVIGITGMRSWWDERDLSVEAEDRFKQLIAAWPKFRFASEHERVALNLAAWRISWSFARIGRWQLHDRILDYAIALEILLSGRRLSAGISG